MPSFVQGQAPPRLLQFVNASAVWGDLFNRPVCGFFQSGKTRK
jgi:hypothetical protein